MRKSTVLENYRVAAMATHGSAKSLPFDVYHSKEVAEIERENIFNSAWIFVCAEARLREVGDYFAFNLCGEPIVVLRGKDQVLRALSNVCRHRGTPILDDGFGNTTKLVCPYHAWTYNHQGKLLGAPFSKDGEVNKEGLCLPSFNIEVWRGLIFISIEEQAKSLSSSFVELNPFLDQMGADQFKQISICSIEHWNSNWKLVMENAMESYHLFKVHKNTLETVTPTKQAFYLQGRNSWSLTAGKIDDAENTLTKWLSGSKHTLYSHYFLIMLPPNFVGIMTYDSFDWVSVLPTLDGGCMVYSDGLSKTKSKASATTQEFVDQFFVEDKEICERVQKGMTSRQSSGGPLLEVERVVVDFHHYLARQIFKVDCETKYQSEEVRNFLLAGH